MHTLSLRFSAVAVLHGLMCCCVAWSGAGCRWQHCFRLPLLVTLAGRGVQINAATMVAQCMLCWWYCGGSWNSLALCALALMADLQVGHLWLMAVMCFTCQTADVIAAAADCARSWARNPSYIVMYVFAAAKDAQPFQPCRTA